MKDVARWVLSAGLAMAVAGLFGACGSDGDGPLENKNPGDNDLNVVVAFGDSLTEGSDCDCVPYPPRLASLIGKTVHNEGEEGSKAEDNVGRTQDAINAHHPAYMIILYGVNDIIRGNGVDSILPALNEMVSICKRNSVVPVLMTYPVLTYDHEFFAGGALALNAGIRAIAKAEGIRCVDLEKEFSAGDDPAFPGWPLPDYALYEPDGLHPNDLGTQIIAMACADLF